MSIKTIILYLLALGPLIVPMNSYSKDEEKNITFQFKTYQNYIRNYEIKEIIEARAQVVSVSKYNLLTRLFDKNCGRSYYYQYDKTEHKLAYILKRNLLPQAEVNVEGRVLTIKGFKKILKTNKKLLKEFTHKLCGSRTYILVLVEGLLKNGHRFHSDFLLQIKQIHEKGRMPVMDIHDENQTLSYRSVNPGILKPTLLLDDHNWQSVWDELDPQVIEIDFLR